MRSKTKYIEKAAKEIKKETNKRKRRIRKEPEEKKSDSKNRERVIEIRLWKRECQQNKNKIKSDVENW